MTCDEASSPRRRRGLERFCEFLRVGDSSKYGEWVECMGVASGCG